MCRCSPVLKSITASLMNHFESSRQKQASHSPKQMEACCKLVRCLSKVNTRLRLICDKLSLFKLEIMLFPTEMPTTPILAEFSLISSCESAI